MTANFIPRQKCTVASGDCFTAGRCLGDCGRAAKRDHEARIQDLERRLKRAETALAQLCATPAAGREA